MIEYLQNLDVFSWQIISLLVVAGFSVGFINTFAGSGSVISYSFFMLLGLPAHTANGTIRLGVVLQTLAATYNFYKKDLLEVKKGFLISIPIILGSVTGALIAVNIDKNVFEKVVGVIMVIMLFFIFYKPQRWLRGKEQISEKPIKFWHYIIYYLIGIYGGFIHIGVGIFLLAALVLVSGYDLVKANAIKLLTVFLYTPFALLVYIMNDQVSYAIGLTAAIGNLAGGIVASKLAVKKGATFIRWILIGVIFLFSAKLFGLYSV